MTEQVMGASSEGSRSGVVEVAAPAKINLGLRIVGRRDDGYHEIESLFVPLALHDELRLAWAETPGEAPRVGFTLESAGEPVASGSPVPTDENNLAAQAAARFLAAAGLPVAVEISLKKKIPTAAGLGGGSSDAAAVLRGLDRAFPDRLPSGELAELALGLGADVPYFLDPRSAWVTGIGEGVAVVEGVTPFSVMLVNPGQGLPTADVYSAWDALHPALTPAKAGSTMPALTGFLDDSRPLSERFANLLVNDLELAAVNLCPEVESLQSRLLDLGSLAVGMSGSGATVFGVFPDHETARLALEQADFGAPIWAEVTIAGDPKSYWGVAKW